MFGPGEIFHCVWRLSRRTAFSARFLECQTKAVTRSITQNIATQPMAYGAT
jgi:hypothetical protein